MTIAIAATEPTYSLGQLVGYMRRDLVERRGWITAADYDARSP
ncbi:hypothetical protein [Burkholderia stabilis]|nr:hypothetical protein [Burkholderia stabilis]